mmetsp:Transcript_66259/g.76900  ORF Transcript_66259/g.76900 Transcript_66259/m.76900 type:complete len:113 (-) Transcript_66259:89-427(-)
MIKLGQFSYKTLVLRSALPAIRQNSVKYMSESRFSNETLEQKPEINNFRDFDMENPSGANEEKITSWKPDFVPKYSTLSKEDKEVRLKENIRAVFIALLLRTIEPAWYFFLW